MSHSRETIHWITNHVTTYLSTLPGTSSISLSSPHPASPHQLQKWESQSSLPLPPDLKSFYSYCGDGLTFRWYASSASVGIRSGEVLDMRKAVNKYGVSAQDISSHTLPNPSAVAAAPNHEINDDSKYLAGLGHINGISDLTPIHFPDESDDPFLEYYNRLNYGDNYIMPCDPSWNSNGVVKAFSVHDLDSFGTVALVYGLQNYRDGLPASNDDNDDNDDNGPIASSPSLSSSPKKSTATPPPSLSSAPEVWFRDRSNKWWFLCKDFTCYLRLMIVHLGIRGWWTSFTTHNLDLNCRQLMIRFCPERMLFDEANKIYKTPNDRTIKNNNE
ncbi:hypothetical protein TrST_g10431 [Triparma strigata]|uniref:Knr4/Smi1-like domain-containing protein n=1 Tax=Triparma strigata TaxID=1606541 RepID=A0A9W7C416_9STRA|nr:hypothetical protein TrST_g10431 [Triparma strigata]